MERTLDIIMEELELAKEERNPLSEALKLINDKIYNLEKEKERYKIDNKMYYPISELSNYIGKRIDYIILVERNECGILVASHMYNDEYLEVDKNGHLDYSSEYGGVMNYDEESGKYIHWLHYNDTEHDYIGFLEIEFEDGTKIST